MGFFIKWKNKLSGEEGFVEKTSTKEKCFYNTFDMNSAKPYANESTANRTIKQLEDFGQGEAINNEFELISM